ncbi:unnamed protein product [Scytosiphon promiscuus]
MRDEERIAIFNSLESQKMASGFKNCTRIEDKQQQTRTRKSREVLYVHELSTRTNHHPLPSSLCFCCARSTPPNKTTDKRLVNRLLEVQNALSFVQQVKPLLISDL